MNFQPSKDNSTKYSFIKFNFLLRISNKWYIIILERSIEHEKVKSIIASSNGSYYDNRMWKRKDFNL